MTSPTPPRGSEERARLRLRRERFVVGLRGLALLRGWPFGSEEAADAQLEAIRKALAPDHGDAARTFIEVDSVDPLNAYASWAETYAGWNPLIVAEEPAVRAFLDDIHPGLALDAATGTGRIARALTGLGHRVVAFDASPQMLSRAQTTAPDALLVRADVRTVPMRDATFDVVVCALALTHLESLREPIAELARVLKPGGSLILSDIHPVAAVTGAHAFFARRDGSSGVTRNAVHWPSSYIDAFVSADLVVEGASEPLFDESFLDEMQEASMRDAARAAVVGLPFALVWRLRKSGRPPATGCA